MPSGGGSFGGGGGGGGGGFSGGHYGSGGSSDGRGGCVFFPASILTAIIVVMIYLMVRYTTNVNTGSDTYYSPGDSRLIELNTLFCDRIKLSESSPRTDAELYLLTKNEIPPITDRNNFTIDSDFTVQRNEYQFWQYHLYPNSNVSISACISAGSSVTLYVIKGTDNYNNWLSDGSSSYSEQNVLISEFCNVAVARNGTALNINQEAEWYFAFANRNERFSSVVSAQLNFERFQYTTEMLSEVNDKCSTIGDGGCNLDVEFRSSRKYALIVTSIPEYPDVDWGENVDVEWKCDRNHGGYFLVIGVPIFGLVFLIILVVVLILGAACLYMNKDKINVCWAVDKFHRARKSSPSHDQLEVPPTSSYTSSIIKETSI